MVSGSANKIFISLGSNMGNRPQNLSTACDLLNEKVGKVTMRSKIYETEPWGFESSAQFLNQVVCLVTEEPPEETLKLALSIENEMGRKRSDKKYSSRIIDIDIIFFDQRIIQTDLLQVPHPRLQERKFVLIPLADIAPDFVHPVFGKTVGELLDECKDGLEVKDYNTCL